MKFIIEDWAGNVLFNGKEFDSFEDGWEFLFKRFPDEEDFSDYFVEVKKCPCDSCLTA